MATGWPGWDASVNGFSARNVGWYCRDSDEDSRAPRMFLPKVVEQILRHAARSGAVKGVTGSGKSTTAGRHDDRINRLARACGSRLRPDRIPHRDKKVVTSARLK